MPAVNAQIVLWMDDLISRGDTKSQEGLCAPLESGMDREFVIGWVTGCISCVQEVYGTGSPFYTTLQVHRDIVIIREHFLYCLGFIKEARRQYVNGYHLRLKELITGDVFDDFLEQAAYLLEENYYQAAAVIVGGVLEDTLRKLCNKNGIVMAAKPTIGLMNDELRNKSKAASQEFYPKVLWRKVQTWGDIRNHAAHAEWDKFNRDDVQEMLDGVSRFIQDYPAS